MSCARPPNFLLRKQKSLVCESVCQPTLINTRERRLRLQKQYSVDQSRDVGNTHRSINNTPNQLKNGNIVNNSWSGTTSSPEASLRIFTAIKTKSQQNHDAKPNNEVQNVSENAVVSNKPRKKIEEKINLNIFLGHNATSNELDLESDTDIVIRQPNGKLKNVNDSGNQHESKIMSNRLSAETRRSQFRQKSISLNESRPRLMRAMSAPIRQNPPPEARDKTSSPNNQNVTKKRLRRKKIAPIEIDPFCLKIAQSQQYSNRNFMTHRPFDDRPSTAKAISSRPIKIPKAFKPPVQPRAKSAVNGCEIVTLVSLLSDGASDSEKEDCSNGTNESISERNIPSLRKVGKSVSFQDDDCFGDEEPIIDLPSVLRRASLVPLAAKIRLNRPPTAPPGSIFNKPSTINENGMSTDKKVVTNTEITSDHSIPQLGQTGAEISKAPINIMNATASSRKSSIDVLDASTVYPEYVRSIKEKECWILFQKMANKGISVSYDTILRGMLTPTEVRAVEKKQKEIIERQASIELEANTTASECDTNKQ